ncbi:MAG: hypothetical protein NZM29_00670, partial [Nitrospira sp.]|nr:hypothetical protein [Nitrospira sp.]
SPREAAQRWFGRPVSGPEDGLFNWNYSEHDYDRRIAVVITTGANKSAPTVDVLDDGIGIRPEEFPSTILSLQSGNKIKKWYLIGAFGQGGASTLAFCDYAIVVSRHRDQSSVVGFTVIRVLKLGAQYKEDCYGYLCLRNPSGTVSVPSCQIGDAPLAVYQQQGARIPTLQKGTLVRHIGFKLPKLDGSLAPSPGNLYHYLHCSAFDPLLPFRLIDLRGETANNQIVTGSRNRLMRLAQASASAVADDTGSQMRYHREMEYFAPHGTQDPSIGIEYWVVFNYRKGRGTQREQLVLRPHSNELFVQTGHPVIGTLNGQNQGEFTAQLLRDVGLTMVARHIVIHIDASKADSRVRRELFSTNREGFKDGPVLTSLIALLKKMLEEDQTLYEIERELTEKFARREAQTTRDEVKRQVARLLQEAGLQVKQEGPSSVPGGQEPAVVQKQRRGRPQKPNPLPTLPFPEVTKFTIATPTPKMSVRINDSEVLLVETDADSEFDHRGLVGIRSEPSCLELAGKSPLRGGRIRWRLRPRQTAMAGDVGRIIVTLTKLDGAQLTDAIDFEVLPALEEKTKKAKGYVPPFEIIPINPEDNQEEWALAWPNLGEDTLFEHQAAVSYKPVRVGGGITVYYSTIFGPFKEQVEKLKSENQAMSELFR